MKVFVLAVTTAAVLLLVSTPIRGDGDTLQKWIVAAKGESFHPLADPGVSSAYTESTPVKGSDDIIAIAQTNSITAGVSSTNKGTNLVAYHDTTSFPIEEDLTSPANYLTWGMNKATAMVLDHERGDFFFTAALTGCEVWVAERTNHEPLVIHANANGVEDPVGKLNKMQNLAFQVLNHFNKNLNKNNQYIFVQRIAYDYAENDDVKFSAEAMNNYWSTFNTNKIPVCKYANTNGLFYGYYTAGKWQFALKDLTTGGVKKCQKDSTCFIL